MIPLAKPFLGDDESQAVAEVLRSGWVTQGPKAAAFEEAFAAFVGAEHACVVSNCTAALHLALKAAGVGPGGDVVTVSHTFIAAANAIHAVGARPVFVDIRPGTFNMNPSQVEAAITDRTRAILCVHQMGMPCELEAIVEIARRRSLPVIEDAACAVGSEIFWSGGWEKIGRPHGDVACFSFHPRKVITCGEGGMLTTSNSEWDQKFRLWRNQGSSVPAEARHTSKEIVFETYPEPGSNYRMTDIQAAVGLEQLKHLPDFIACRRHLAERYRSLFAALPGFETPEEPEWARSNWQSYCVRLPDECDQRALMLSLREKSIATARGIMCIHREPSWPRGSWKCAPDGLDESEKAQDRCILLPIFHEMGEEEQREVIGRVKEWKNVVLE